MRGRQTLVAAALLFAGIGGGSAAFAQTTSASGIDVFGVTGPNWMWEDEGYLGPAWGAGGGIGYRAGRAGIELVGDFRRHRPDFDSDVVFKAGVARLAGRLLLYFGQRDAQPFVGAGLSATHVDRLSEFPDDCRFVDHVRVCEGVRRFESAYWTSALATFGGVRVAVNERWFVRPEFGIEWPGKNITMSALVAVGRSW